MKRYFIIAILLFIAIDINSQDFLSQGRLTGIFQVEAQTYTKDSLIGAPDVDEKVLSNSFLFLNYNMDNFDFGIRYEAYLNPLLGIDARYEGQGISFRYGAYKSEKIDITVGNFYEQFGSGLILRAYEARPLGLDNAFDGINVKVRPVEGIEITGLIGKQRNFWSLGEGIVRAGDIQVNFNDLFSEPISENWEYNAGFSFVSKFQEDPPGSYILPENVFAYTARFDISSFDYSFSGEYAYKINDPNITNNFNYNEGKGIIFNAAMFKTGFSASVNAHWIDNMDFRSDRDATLTQLTIGFIAPLTKQHTYRLATTYPFATQFNGEGGVQAEVTYKIPKKSLLGGKYGTTINMNYSRVQEVERTPIDDFTYDTDIFSVGDKLYFQDLNFDIGKRWNKNLKTKLNYINMFYDRDVIENQGSPKYGTVTADILILDNTYKINSKNAIKLELQHMWSEQDSVTIEPDNINGDWAMALIEYTIAPHFFISFWDEYNYGNDDESRRLHYLNASFAYVFDTTRIQLAYGKQRGGIVCVGGICRPVPASNGFYLTVSSSF